MPSGSCLAGCEAHGILWLLRRVSSEQRARWIGMTLVQASKRGLAVAALSLIMGWGSPSLAHEFWISPERYRVDVGGKLEAALLSGDKFEGASTPYVPDEFKRFELLLGAETIKVPGRLGDDPALRMTVEKPGLGVIVHQTTGFYIHYAKEGQFEGLLRDRGLLHVLKTHRERGLPEAGFQERFIRFAKCLVVVGHGRGRDVKTGLETEFVAQNNPYTDDTRDGLPFQLLYQGKARADVQVEVFTSSPAGEVAVEILRTDQEGRVTVPAKPGYEYLLSSVVFRPLEAAAGSEDPVWESLWAQFTYTIPPDR